MRNPFRGETRCSTNSKRIRFVNWKFVIDCQKSFSRDCIELKSSQRRLLMNPQHRIIFKLETGRIFLWWIDGNKTWVPLDPFWDSYLDTCRNIGDPYERTKIYISNCKWDMLGLLLSIHFFSYPEKPGKDQGKRAYQKCFVFRKFKNVHLKLCRGSFILHHPSRNFLTMK